MQQHAKPMQLRADSYLSAFSFLSTYVEYESWRCTAISELMINEQIRDKEVRLIGENGEQLGIMSAKDAYKMARDAELDLVKIAPAAKPPVCKIIDYGKYKYEMIRTPSFPESALETVKVLTPIFSAISTIRTRFCIFPTNSFLHKFAPNCS